MLRAKALKNDEYSNKKGEQRIRMVLTGVTPIMFNPENGALSEKEMTPTQQAEMKVPMSEDGKMGIPAIMLFRNLVEGGRHLEVKLVGRTRRQTLTNPKGSQVGSFSWFEESFFPFLEQKKGWVLDKMRFNAKMADGKVASKQAYRPRFDMWSIAVTTILDVSELAESDFKLLVERSGKRIGLGSYAPRNSGWFGKYKITQWEHC